MLTWVILDEWGNRETRKKRTWDRLKLSQHAMIVEVGGVIDDPYVSLTSRTIDNTTTNHSTKFTFAELLLEDPLPEKLETLLAYEWIECRSSSNWLPRNWPLYIGKRRNSQWLCSIVEVQWSSVSTQLFNWVPVAYCWGKIVMDKYLLLKGVTLLYVASWHGNRDKVCVDPSCS